MRHCDPDGLTLSALGEPALDAADVEHLLSCQRCSDELRALRRTVVTARGPRADVPVDPPPEVWHAVAAELGLTAAAPSPGRAQPLRPAVPGRRERPARGRAAQWLAVAAGAVVLALAAGATGAALADRDGPGDPQPAPQLAQARLDPLPDGPDGPDRPGGEAASGTARLVGDPAARSLEVQVAGLGDSAGYYEVWLIDPATEAMVSLGVLATPARPAVLQVPEGIDVGTYSLVDVSDEPLDGDPTHSRTSVARGALVQG